MKRFPECEERTTAPIKSLQTKGSRSKITFENPKKLELCLIDIDQCSMLSAETRCDYALTVDTVEEEFYVELKGRDVEHGLDQLKASIQMMSSDPYKHPKICFIISTKVTKIVSTKIPGMKDVMRRKYNAKLIIKNTPRIYPF
jgi:hypothetical protein